jgi:hypothetical protein
MKRFSLTFLLVAVLVAVTTITIAQEKPWLDMKNCAFCKTLLKDPQLVENMTFEHHDISNGLLSLTVVKPEFHDSYMAAEHEMEKLAAEVASGNTDIPMCGSCEYYGKLVMAGAKFEHISTCAGEILLITSDKPEVLEMIRYYAKRSRDELAKWEPPVAD